MHTHTLPLLFLLLLPTLQAARLRIVEANVPGGIDSWRKGPTLRPGLTLCPSNLFPQFTVECIADRPATSATLFINGRITRTERVVPYILTGDSNGRASPWSPPMGRVVVRCEVSNGETVQVAITIQCGGRTKMVKRKKTVGGGRSQPRDDDDDDEQNGGGQNNGGGGGASNRGFACVKIRALNYISNRGWERVGNGLVYRRGDSSQSIDSGGEAPVVYRFTVPRASRYGVSLDMETEGGSEHNDVWLEFDEAGGFTLTRRGDTRSAGGWVKAYHNRNGRAVAAFSVDFNAHVFSTRNELRPGQTYTIRLGGRSSKVTIYSIVFFSCSGEDCGDTGNFFGRASTCAA